MIATGGGDAELLARAYALASSILLGVPSGVTARRMRRLAASLLAMADRLDGIDAESVAIERMDAELVAVVAGHRSEGDA